MLVGELVSVQKKRSKKPKNLNGSKWSYLIIDFRQLMSWLCIPQEDSKSNALK